MRAGLILFVWSWATATALAQWETKSYALKGGWNAIYLHGDGVHATPDEHFGSGDGLSVREVWRWNPNPEQAQFTETPLIPSEGTPEWSVWKRGLPLESNLTEMVGQTAYLVRCAGSSANSYSVDITTKPLAPRAVWVRNGANLLGFPTNASGGLPTFAAYFATFPAATAANSSIFEYVGGELGPGNPMKVFSPTVATVDPTKAYWFESEVVGNFYAPVEVSFSDSRGLVFGRSGALATMRVRNRTGGAVTLSFGVEGSGTKPVGEEDIEEAVPLVRRVFNAVDLTWTESAVGAGFDVVVGPQSTVEVHFGIDRGMMTADAGTLYASVLRVADSGSLMDVALPVSARVSSLAGLWIGEAEVSEVESQVAGSPGATTSRAFPLRVMLHVAEDGTATLLSQVFMGRVADAPHGLGLCTAESGLKADEKADAWRLVAGHLPLDQAIGGTGAGNSGSVALGEMLVRTVRVGFDDATNPFKHQYHPDHDNKGARGVPLVAGKESYDIERVCEFDFSVSAPAGSSAVGWGTQVIGGDYRETLKGLHKEDIEVGGRFELTRVSEIGVLSPN